MPDDVPAVEARDELFGVPVGVFVAARDDLARRLTADGQPDEAKQVKALRRPTLSAWAVNQVVRTEHDTWEELLAAGQQVQRAQRRALSGVRDSGLREAAASRRELVESLTGRARALLVEAGVRPDSHLDDVAATFEAASADPDAAAEVSAAQLSASVRMTSDFSGTALLAVSAVPTTDEDTASDGDPGLVERRRSAIRALEKARARADASAAAARDALAAAKSLGEQASQARDGARAARRVADRAEHEADDLAARAEAAQADANTAVATAERDGEAADEARAVLDGLA